MFLNIGATAQLVNNGELFISDDAILFYSSHLINNVDAYVVNDGNIQIDGDLINNGDFDSGANSSFYFSGTGVKFIKTNGASFPNLGMSNSGSFLSLLDDLVIGESFHFMDSNTWVLLNDKDLIFKDSAEPIGYSSNAYFITNGQGKYVVESPGTIMPIGYNQFNYLPAFALPINQDPISIRVYENAFSDGVEGGMQITEDVVNATWEIEKNTPGNSEITVLFMWFPVNEATGFDRTNCGIGWHDGISYTGTGLTAANETFIPYSQLATFPIAPQSAKYIVGGIPALNYVSFTPKIFLHGPFNGNDMNDNLRLAQSLPLVEPHTALGFTHFGLGGNESVSSIADFDNPGTSDDIVDWVFVELRKLSTGVQASYSGLLQRDGDIVGTDMNPMKFYTMPPDDYYVTIRHRNHLGVFTAFIQSLDKSPNVLDFTDGSVTVAGGASAQIFLPNANVYALWPGDANRDGQVNSVDKNTAWRVQNGGMYDYFNSTADFNLDATINSVDKNMHWRIANSQSANYNY